MRLVTFETPSGARSGVVREDAVYPIKDVDMLGIIRAGEPGLKLARQALSDRSVPLDSVKLLAPIPLPQRNIFCLGRNYAEHLTESARARGVKAELPELPIFFTKSTTTINGPYSDVPVESSVSDKMDWEVELAVVIGTGGKNIAAEEAMNHIFGYTVVNDITARDLQIKHGGQWFKGKSLDGTCPMGPWIATRDEISDSHALGLRSRVNGVLKQDSSTAFFIFDLPTIIQQLSQGMTLLPGDIIATGTPGGVGYARTPPEFLKPGDVVECEVDGIGLIRNRIVARR